MNPAQDRAAAAFADAFGGLPDGVAFAPGRVNLIGDHVDYNDGLVLPMPLALGTAVAWRRSDSPGVAARAADYHGEAYAFAPSDPAPQGDGWHSLVHGMAALMQEAAPLEGGLDLLIAGNLPRGAGLSSSASLCIAVGRAILAASSATPLPSEALARIAQAVEHRFAGVACGIMDQMAIAAGTPGAAMLLDCRSLGWQAVALPDDWSVLLVQSGVSRELVDGAYNTRRAECESAARKLGVASLRDVDPANFEPAPLSPAEARRARHVVFEIERTRRAAAAIAAGEIAALGALLREAHASMRDLFEASHPEVDRQVDLINAMIGPDGGARMTGGGFGGAIVAILPTAQAGRLTQDLARLHPDGAAADLTRVFH
jgi:galactokinase